MTNSFKRIIGQILSKKVIVNADKKTNGKNNIWEVFSGIIFPHCMLKFALGFHWYSGSVSQARKHQIKHHPWIVFGNIISVVMQTSIFVVVTSTLLILLVLMQNALFQLNKWDSLQIFQPFTPKHSYVSPIFFNSRTSIIY